MANRKNFEAAIEIGGKLDRSLGDSINKASNGFSKLERTGNKAATNIDRKFTYLGAHMKGKFVGSIGRATRAMGGLAAKSVAALGAVSLAYAGFRSVGDFIHNSIDKYLESVDGLQQLETALRNNPILAKQGAAAILEQRDAVVKLAKESQDLSAIRRSVFQAGFSELATGRFGANEIGRIQEGYRDYLAHHYGTRATPDQARALSEQIFEAVAGGRAGALGKELVFTNENLKELRTANARLTFINKKMVDRYGDAAKDLATKNPEGKLALERYKFYDPIEEYGKKFLDLQDRWELLTLQTLVKLKPFIDPAIDWASGAVDSIVRFFEELGKPKHAVVLEELGRMFHKAWENIEAFGGAFVSAFGQNSGAFQRISSGISGLLEGEKPDMSDSHPPWMPDWAKYVDQDTGGSLNRPITVFDRLHQILQDAGDALEKIRPDFEKAGEGLAKFAAIDFDALATGLRALGSATRKVLDAFGGTDKIMKRVSGFTGPASSTLGEFHELVEGIIEKKPMGVVNDTAGKFLFGPFWDLFRPPAKEGAQSSDTEVQPIPERATGGIFRKAHLAMIGEAGPEAVIPLKRSKRSLGLLDEAAGAIGVRSSAPTIHRAINIKPTINITGVDSGTAQQVADEIISIVKGAMENEESASIATAAA